MQNSENRGSLSDKFQNFGAKPSDGLWNAISNGLDTGKPVQSKRSKSLWKSLFWASAGFFAASAIAITIWITSSNRTTAAGNHFIASESINGLKQTDHKTTPQAKSVITASSTIKNKNSSTANDKYIGTSISAKQQEKSSSRNKNTLGIHVKESVNYKNGDTRRDTIQKTHWQKQQKQHVKKQSFHRSTGEQALNRNPTNKNDQFDVTSADVNDSQMNNASDNMDNSATNSALNAANNPEDITASENDSSIPHDSLVTNTSPDNNSTANDSSVATNPASVFPAPAQKPAKWMLGGHIGATHGNVYILNFEQDQYTNPDMLTNSTLKYLPAHLYWSADIQLSKKIGKRFWVESGIQGGMQHVKQNPNPNTTSISASALQPVEGRAYNLGIPLAFRFDFTRKGKIQFYERIGTLHTFPYAISARYISSNSSQPEKWMHYQYWTYTLSAYFNFGMEYPIRENLYWDIRTEVRFTKEMVSTHRNYDNTLWYGGSTGIIWKF